MSETAKELAHEFEDSLGELCCGFDRTVNALEKLVRHTRTNEDKISLVFANFLTRIKELEHGLHDTDHWTEAIYEWIEKEYKGESNV